jgi:multidrug efflux pump subunit AcrA (membrane-fusion protein)
MLVAPKDDLEVTGQPVPAGLHLAVPAATAALAQTSVGPAEIQTIDLTSGTITYVPPQLPAYASRPLRSRRQVALSLVLAAAVIAAVVATIRHLYVVPAPANAQAEPASRVDLNFKTPGRIVAVNVRPGDRVQQGQVLAVQDAGPAKASVDAARATLMADQARLALLQQPASQLDQQKERLQIQQAQQQLQAAATGLQETQSVGGATVVQAQQTLANATDTLARDRATFSSECPAGGATPRGGGGNAGVDCAQLADRLQQDNDAVTSDSLAVQRAQLVAQQSNDLANRSSVLANTQLQLAQADANLKLAPATAADIAGAEAQVAADQASLASRQQDLIDLQLLAPADAIVASVAGTVGGFVDPNGVRVYDLQANQQDQSHFQLLPSAPSYRNPSANFVPTIELYGTTGWQVVAQVSENDAVRAVPGQRATVVLPAFHNLRIPARVHGVVAQPLRSNTKVLYNLILDVNTLPPNALPGMSARVILNK